MVTTKNTLESFGPLMTRAQAVASGISEDMLSELTYDLAPGELMAPAGKIGALRGLTRHRGRKGKGYRHYRTSDVAQVLGIKL